MKVSLGIKPVAYTIPSNYTFVPYKNLTYGKNLLFITLNISLLKIKSIPYPKYQS